MVSVVVLIRLSVGLGTIEWVVLRKDTLLIIDTWATLIVCITDMRFLALCYRKYVGQVMKKASARRR